MYAWWSLEKNHGSRLTNFDDFFNLTFTYRRDSGIYAPYGSINLILRELREAKETDLEALLAKKRESGKVAAWAVSATFSVEARVQHLHFISNIFHSDTLLDATV